MNVLPSQSLKAGSLSSRQYGCLLELSQLFTRPQITKYEYLSKCVEIIPRAWPRKRGICVSFLYKSKSFSTCGTCDFCSDKGIIFHKKMISLLHKNKLADIMISQKISLETSLEPPSSEDQRFLELITSEINAHLETFENKANHSGHHEDTLPLPHLNLSPLTPAELRICNLVKQGLMGKEIAHELHVSESTVKTHKKNIRKKLQLSRQDNLLALLIK